MELELIADGLLNEFVCGVQKNDRVKWFRGAIGVFVRFGDDNGVSSLEVGRPVS